MLYLCWPAASSLHPFNDFMACNDITSAGKEVGATQEKTVNTNQEVGCSYGN